MAAIESYRDLETYRVVRAQVKRIFEITRSLPKEERYSLTDQIRRSSRAVKAMIAEAWGRRRYVAAFENKISEALGEALELDPAWQGIGGKLNRMIQRAETFCPKR